MQFLKVWSTGIRNFTHYKYFLAFSNREMKIAQPLMGQNCKYQVAIVPSGIKTYLRAMEADGYIQELK